MFCSAFRGFFSSSLSPKKSHLEPPSTHAFLVSMTCWKNHQKNTKKHQTPAKKHQKSITITPAVGGIHRRFFLCFPFLYPKELPRNPTHLENKGGSAAGMFFCILAFGVSWTERNYSRTMYFKDFFFGNILFELPSLSFAFWKQLRDPSFVFKTWFLSPSGRPVTGLLDVLEVASFQGRAKRQWRRCLGSLGRCSWKQQV